MNTLAHPTSAEVLLRITHLSNIRAGWCEELGYDGWFVRFAGSQEAFDDMRNVLKSLTRLDARWTPAYTWPDGKSGAWWIDETVFLVLFDSFANAHESMVEATNIDIR